MRKIAVITGSRADESPFGNVIKLLGKHCIHIKTEGLYEHEQFIRKSLQRVKPDFLVLLGDRYETLVAATVAAMLTIPVVHLHGGEITEGAVDDSFRHAISKLSYYHFVCHAKYKARLERLGESPERIFVTGAPGVDDLQEIPFKNNTKGKYSLCCLHSETLGRDLRNLVELVLLLKDKRQVWANCNADKALHNKGKNYSRIQWLDLMYHSKELIGNSSSFIFEGMTLGKKVIMIGDRQKGRYDDAVEFFKTEKYPYGTPGYVSPRIVDLLLILPIPEKPKKVFYE
jgi:UDP-hydrolysing UDP-N-acetyl-D-glucosamine 2-epimerase